MLPVFLVLLVLLLSLVAIAVQFGRYPRMLKKLPVLKKLSIVVLAMSALVIPSRTSAQITGPDQNSPTAPPLNESPETDVLPAQSPVFERPVSWKLMFGNVMADQKHMWSFPARL